MALNLKTSLSFRFIVSFVLSEAIKLLILWLAELCQVGTHQIFTATYSSVGCIEQFDLKGTTGNQGI